MGEFLFRSCSLEWEMRRIEGDFTFPERKLSTKIRQILKEKLSNKIFLYGRPQANKVTRCFHSSSNPHEKQCKIL